MNKKYKISNKPCRTCGGLISFDDYPNTKWPIHVDKNGNIMGNGSCPKFKKRNTLEIIETTKKKLNEMDYREAKNKKGLFYKPISIEDTSGAVFADLRGTWLVRISSDPRPYIYYKDVPFRSFMIEVATLKRAGIEPRFSFYDTDELEGFAVELRDIPDGYCNSCGKDIINVVDWDFLNRSFEKKIDDEGYYIVSYCDDCRDKAKKRK